MPKSIALYRTAKGTEEPTGESRSIAIRFDNDIFISIRDAALANEVSFAEQVRIFVGRGMQQKGKAHAQA